MRATTKNWFLRNRPFLFFIPAIGLLMGWALLQQHLSWLHAAGWFVGGLFLWTVLEWVLHRGMHVHTGLAAVRRIQDEVHMRHHREPHDLEHSVVRLRSSVPIAGVLLGVAWLCLGDIQRAAVMLCGLLCGYLFYEFVHLTGHASRPIPGLRYLHGYHAAHHYGAPNCAYGVTSPLWDWVFRCRPRRVVSRKQ